MAARGRKVPPGLLPELLRTCKPSALALRFYTKLIGPAGFRPCSGTPAAPFGRVGSSLRVGSPRCTAPPEDLREESRDRGRNSIRELVFQGVHGNESSGGGYVIGRLGRFAPPCTGWRSMQLEKGRTTYKAQTVEQWHSWACAPGGICVWPDKCTLGSRRPNRASDAARTWW